MREESAWDSEAIQGIRVVCVVVESELEQCLAELGEYSHQEEALLYGSALTQYAENESFELVEFRFSQRPRVSLSLVVC